MYMSVHAKTSMFFFSLVKLSNCYISFPFFYLDSSSSVIPLAIISEVHVIVFNKSLFFLASTKVQVVHGNI